MTLSLFVGFDNNRQNILLAQALLIDESFKSHSWMFQQIIKATNVYSSVILTNADPAVDSAICQILVSTYPIHCAYHITQNLHKNFRKKLGETYQRFLNDFYRCRNSLSKDAFEHYFNNLIQDFPNAKSYLEFLYKSKDHWAHCFIKYKFTGGMIATSCVESVLLRKQYQLRLVMLDNNNLYFEYRFWHAAIPNAQNQDKVNFLFTEIDQCLQRYLKSNILKMLYDQINQLVYYTANRISQQDVTNEEANELLDIQEDSIDKPQATLDQIIEFTGLHNVKEIWAITVGNSLKIKHHILMLQNNSYLCSCLSIIQCGIVCRHYFQLMLTTQEPFLMTDKFTQDMITLPNNSPIPYLYLFREERADFRKENMMTFEQRIVYGKLYSMYKKALNKALENKKRKGKGRPLGTKRLKSSYEAVKPKVKQQC
ncbi:22652_t:CDS:2 [Cetraspora pellucida]|uniref:22652_t:CDS:1 n=1 Tax=Cetraspora pellucida TaxID=1433469 RepID=A0A9N9JMI0_9GLOM|nr:22652_t:CDS:2 [Cetraspora pellucida]